VAFHFLICRAQKLARVKSIHPKGRMDDPENEALLDT
jgi:hypothetical protein